MEEPSPRSIPEAAHALGPLDRAADPCFVLDLEGRILAANDGACAALDVERNDLLGRRAWEVCTCLTEHGFDWTVAALRAEGPQTLLGHLRRRDGALVSTDTHLWLAPLPGHGPAGEARVYALARELRGTRNLAEERAQLESLVEASSELVALFDRHGRLTYANAAGLALLGFEDPRDAQGLAVQELFALDQRVLVEETVLPRAEHERWEGELGLRSWRADHVTPCFAQAFAVRHSRTGKRIGLALIARDVTLQRSAEARRARLVRLTEVSRAVATELLRSDDLNQAVFHILAGVTETLGASRGFLNRFREDGSWILRTHEWSRAEGPVHRSGEQPEPEGNQRWATQILRQGEPVLIVDAVPLPPPHGRGLLEPGERALLALPVFIQGELANVFGFACHGRREWAADEVAALQIIVDSFARGVERQIAEREKLAARRELERAVERETLANRYKSEFLASMSHELRTPMNAIRGYAELLGRPHPERALQALWIQNLRRSTEYLLGLIHDVLDLSKIEAGHMQLVREPASLADVLCAVDDLLAASAREKCLDFRIEIAGEVPERFETDPVRLKQILVNLAGNAIKFTETGSVALRVQRLEGSPARLEIAVHDTGIGIPAQAIEKLFRPFAQVDSRVSGTGLGLQISRSLARLLGGDIRVQSELGSGSTFTLDVPLAGESGVLRAFTRAGGVPSARARPLSADVSAALAGKRVLVVDDSLENREVLGFLLQEAGATCETAMDGQAGVERALAAQRERAPFDAILMDMNMPVLDGFEATRRLVAAGVASPVIALTALALAGDEERCLAAGCVAYVGKPIVPSVFFETLARHLTPCAGPHPPAPVPQPEARAPAEDAGLSIAQHPRFRALVERYTASFPELVLRLRALEREDKLEELRTLVHRLRGTAASYGFPTVSQAAGRCEDAIRARAPREELRRGLEELLGRLSLAVAG